MTCLQGAVSEAILPCYILKTQKTRLCAAERPDTRLSEEIHRLIFSSKANHSLLISNSAAQMYLDGRQSTVKILKKKKNMLCLRHWNYSVLFTGTECYTTCSLPRVPVVSLSLSLSFSLSLFRLYLSVNKSMNTLLTLSVSHHFLHNNDLILKERLGFRKILWKKIPLAVSMARRTPRAFFCCFAKLYF